MAPKAVISTLGCSKSLSSRPWDGSKGCHLDPGMPPKPIISTGGEAGVERPLYFVPSTPTRSGMRAKSTWLYPPTAPAFLVVIPEGDLRFPPCGYTHPGMAPKTVISTLGWLQSLSSRPEAKPEWRDPCISFPPPHTFRNLLPPGPGMRAKPPWLYPPTAPAFLVVIPKGICASYRAGTLTLRLLKPDFRKAVGSAISAQACLREGRGFSHAANALFAIRL